MRKVFRIYGLVALIFILTATTVFAANQSSTAYATGGGNDASSSYINGQGQMGKIKFNSSGGGYGFYEKSCTGTVTTYGPASYIPADGGSVEQLVAMPSNCKFKLHITSGVFPVAGTIQNYS
ncbi:hypothetical protein [Paenibacillus paeoniae]|uniref:Uncharacterized protein n=1 Tax=Paenibacillus paeoniae TaxID=2292705 RepID=A0A371P5Z1_9BACL|nr:hypothetical protein [Paenibacillus paeoniae]REK71373.1 hypothetical protein DX130_20415 [Paenibacillus paeoniae]